MTPEHLKQYLLRMCFLSKWKQVGHYFSSVETKFYFFNKRGKIECLEEGTKSKKQKIGAMGLGTVQRTEIKMQHNGRWSVGDCSNETEKGFYSTVTRLKKG
ncbi:hypothetical protein CEXT_7761 [Caerostris extrusa]|uniref:LAGLIDADG homing endonuclease n=1 Tax=Caerostris extrusa TaxID=172846 RepID=A0AAV4Y0Q6_CAEEX|nr:hypothetical protein CEXT_7761 [Caerostris extrusa]